MIVTKEKLRPISCQCSTKKKWHNLPLPFAEDCTAQHRLASRMRRFRFQEDQKGKIENTKGSSSSGRHPKEKRLGKVARPHDHSRLPGKKKQSNGFSGNPYASSEQARQASA
jgi:hypothetical protein